MLLLAGGLILWVRLLPPQLPSLAPRAESLLRQRLAQREAAALPAELAGEARRVALQRAVDAWIAAHPDDFARDLRAERARLTDALQYIDESGRPHTYLGDYDSYTWMRGARNLLRTGSPCDSEADGVCRDTFTLAPFGYASPYLGSPHIRVIAAVHRLLAWLDPHQPLPASMYATGVAITLLGVLPAFAIGRRLAGPIGGFFAALVSGLHPVLLLRSMGADNDGWNVALPLYAMWAILAALQSRAIARAALGGALAALVIAAHSALWRGWSFGAVVILAGLAGALLLHVVAAWWRSGRARAWRTPGSDRVVATALAFALVLGALLPLTDDEFWPGVLAQASPGAARAAEAGKVEWPSMFDTVSELRTPNLGAIAAQSFGAMVFLVGWFGMLLMLLPRRRWQAGHFAVLSVSALLYRYLLTANALPRLALVALLVAPMLAALVVDLRDGEPQDVDEVAAALPLVAWLLAGLLLSYEGLRYILFLAAPLGIACGVAIG
ncbi:MAG: STT3 domain-containing protein, partial [Deltaproteobacteria bacterium]|nr:STT3 domain-containing protein [Deltaproteobacteria bacterium]